MKQFLLLSLLISALHLQAQPLFTYGKYKVGSNEFLNAFGKNKLPSDTGKEAMKDYLQLYINYKLKIQDAKDIRLDTLPSLRADLQSFRHQIEQNYIYDQKEMEHLVGEAELRSKKDIRVTVWCLKPDGQFNEQTLRTLSEDVLKEIQKDPDADLSPIERKGVHVIREDMGFITVFTLPYDIENVIYGLRAGECSPPVFSDGAYLIFRNEGERPAAGKVKVAQILITAPPGDDAQWKKGASLADSIYRVLKSGGDFSALAKEFSDDRKTYFNGGEMPEFGVGKYSPEFEDQAFSLKYPGAVSQPFKTAFGFHILKLIAADPIDSMKREHLSALVKQEVLQDNRVESAKKKLIESAKIKTGFRSSKLPLKDIYNVTDSMIISGKEITSEGVTGESVLLGFNDHSKITLHDWIVFAKSSGKLVTGKLHQSYDKLMPEFESQSILKNYLERLDAFDKNFTNQMKDFADGNMLFEMTQRKVWGKASDDTTGQQNYFDAHRDRYLWHKSVDAIIFSCNNKETANQSISELQTNSWRKIMELNRFGLQADSGRYEMDQLPLKTIPEKVGLTEPVTNEFDNTTTFVRVIKFYPENTPREFSESKGLVIEDYQKLLDEEWISKLRSRYPVTVNKKVFDALLK